MNIHSITQYEIERLNVDVSTTLDNLIPVFVLSSIVTLITALSTLTHSKEEELTLKT